MAEPIRSEIPTIGTLAGNVLKDSEKLVRQELELFNARLGVEFKEALLASFYVPLSMIFFIGSLFLFAMTAVHLLNGEALLPLWACYGIMTALFLGVGLAFILFRGNKNGK